MIININDVVQVKLTDVGREILRKRYEILPEKYRTLPREDQDGYSSWQLFSVMETFGPHISLGGRTPIESIKIKD